MCYHEYCYTHKKHHSQKKINAIKAEAVLKLDRKERINFDIKSNKLIDMSFKGYKNCIQHQFLNTECGMYSINFIDSFLTQNKTFHQIIQDAIHDDEMNKLRYSKYYRPRSKKNKE